MRRVVRSQGTIVISTPFFHRADHEADRWRFTAAGLTHLARGANLDVERLQPQGAALACAASILRYAASTQPRWRRRFWTLVAAPMLRRLLARDAAWARREPTLATFTTGYLLTARKP